MVSVPGLMEKLPRPVASVLHMPPVWVMRSFIAGIVMIIEHAALPDS